MNRCMIVIDLDTALLESYYVGPRGGTSINNAYSEIRNVLANHGFDAIQGTVYLSREGVRQAHATLAMQDLTVCCFWFAKCVHSVKMYDLADDFNAQFIVNGVENARLNFEAQQGKMRQKLEKKGLSIAEINEVLGESTFTLASVPTLPLKK